MDDKEISHQQSLVQDSFSTIERLESEMAQIEREFENLGEEKSFTEDKIHRIAEESTSDSI